MIIENDNNILPHGHIRHYGKLTNVFMLLVPSSYISDKLSAR